MGTSLLEGNTPSSVQMSLISHSYFPGYSSSSAPTMAFAEALWPPPVSDMTKRMRFFPLFLGGIEFAASAMKRGTSEKYSALVMSSPFQPAIPKKDDSMFLAWLAGFLKNWLKWKGFREPLLLTFIVNPSPAGARLMFLVLISCSDFGRNARGSLAAGGKAKASSLMSSSLSALSTSMSKGVRPFGLSLYWLRERGRATGAGRSGSVE
mmetsp:Transcript_15115/g.35633  ORF Transcript_15115/g.35633 Transcript_15115/m.35633 type:complete len:208 (+) Transcript_15115:495-1118(+)